MSAFVPALASAAEIEHDQVLLRVSDPVGTETSSEAERWSSLVHRIRQGEKDAVEELYRYFYGGIRLFLCRNLGPQELEDKVHDTFVIVLTAVRRGEVRDPTRMAAFVRTVVRRQVANHIGGVIHERRDCVDIDTGGEQLVDERQTPEERVITAERISIMRELLQQVDERDRELLVRFYIHEHSVEDICADLNLSCNQFRLLKSRAKVRFGELGKRALARRAFSRFQGHQKFRSIA